MTRNTAYLFSLLPGVITVSGNFLGGNWVYGNFLYSLVFLALVEWFVPEKKSNESQKESRLPDLILIFHVVLQVLALSTLFYSLKENKIFGFAILGAALSTGVHSGTSAIVIAHEMIHRKSAVWQSLGKFLLFTVGNIYFFVEHLRIHHKWVGTDNDPATARYGENVYSFFIRSVTGQIAGAWKLEKARLTTEQKSVFNFSNYVWMSLLALIFVLLMLYFWLGQIAAFVFALQALIANFLLEYTNYVEHYGLHRDEKERVREMHSWQSDKFVSRFMLIDLSRHSDHHYYASKPYHVLERYEDSPVLPGGYAAAFYLALIPPLWFKVVNKTLKIFHQQQEQKGSVR